MASLGSGVPHLGDSLLFHPLDLSAKTKQNDRNISLTYAQHMFLKSPTRIVHVSCSAHMYTDHNNHSSLGFINFYQLCNSS